ncbi:NAD-dependent epimerase/dehydratase [Cyanobacterium stanieri PCC 7202]|uniref:NAD-dependent epimerase/dehydratase n=1 Tax=Cyanobacterium stanieri (strain ATCC 29140 / PCC 7202) TaxID=292563 RepID=K9YI19_CYASC|nr:NAD-dependent epimerase/dehydratase [Cyanobacterium stanieri PCC 7202]
MKILVAGATGQTGRRIVTELVEKGMDVRGLVRDEAKAKDILPESVELVVGDVLKPSTLKNALQGCDVVICATGATPSLDFTAFYKVDLEGSKNLIDGAKEAGVNKFIFVTSLCVSKFFHPLNLFGLVLFWKKQAEKYLINSGLNYTIVRPGGLKNEDNLYPLVVRGADTLFEGSIPRRKVAQVCVEAISRPETDGKILEIVAQEDAPSQDWDQLLAV